MAGSGKTTFMQRLNAHLHERRTPGYILNLDPAVAHLPYGANVDIRDTVNYKNVSGVRGVSWRGGRGACVEAGGRRRPCGDGEMLKSAAGGQLGTHCGVLLLRSAGALALLPPPLPAEATRRPGLAWPAPAHATTPQVMKQYSLGPNGAILTSLNLFATRFDQVTRAGCWAHARMRV